MGCAPGGGVYDPLLFHRRIRGSAFGAGKRGDGPRCAFESGGDLDPAGCGGAGADAGDGGRCQYFDL